MNRATLMPRFAMVCLALAVPLTAAGAPAKSPAPARNAPKTAATGKPATPVPNTPAPAFYNSAERDKGKYLEPDVVMARIQDRTITVRDFIDEYFYSYAEFRPRPDSLGRVEFLNTLINKNVLGLTASEIQKPLEFEDRARMREFTQRTIGNVLYQRVVLDSVKIPEAAVLREYERYKSSIRIRHIQFESRELAEKVRLDILAGRITWKEAARQYNRAKHDHGPDGELGWASRLGLDLAMAEAVYDLRPGETSRVFQDSEGFQIVQVIDRQTVTPLALSSARRTIESQLRAVQIAERSDRLLGMLADRIGLTYDSTNARFASAFFGEPTTVTRDAKGVQLITINENLPEFQPADTARVLARWKDGGRFTLSQFIDGYSAIQPVLRPAVNTVESFMKQVRGIVLEPYMAQYAIERGLDKDSLATAQVSSRLEQIRAEHMVQDSVESKVFVTSDERRAYFKEHEKEFQTFESRRYAAIAARSRAAADSLAAQLRAGVRPEDILFADSLAGIHRGSIQDRREDEHGPLQKVIFQELRPGQVMLDGPAKDSSYTVVKLISLTPRRQMSFEESQAIADESVMNMKSEALLNQFLARHRRKYRIQSHPELVMKIRLVDPTL
jgi:hypothetical protein